MSSISLLLSTFTPGSLDLLRWDLGAKPKKELTLTYNSSVSSEVAEMTLKINRMSVISSTGEEFPCADFNNQRMQLGSYTRANSLKLKDSVALKPGYYQTVRFYISEESSETFRNRVTQKINGRDYVDFEIQDGLSVTAGELVNFQLSFKFPGFSFRSFWDSYGEMKYTPWMKGRLGAFWSLLNELDERPHFAVFFYVDI